MRTATLVFACVLAAVLWNASFDTSRADVWGECDSEMRAGEAQPADDSRSYAAITKRFQDELADYAYALVFRELEADLRDWIRENGEDEPHRKLLVAFEDLNGTFEHYGEELERVAVRHDSTDSEQARKVTNAFLQKYATGGFQLDLTGADRGWFSGENRVSFDSLDALCREGSQGAAGAKDFVLRATTVDSLIAEFATRDEGLAKTVQGIRLAAARWEHFLSDGKTMYPWEAVFNALLVGGGTMKQPPMHQWMLLHPQLCASVSTERVRDLRAGDAFLVEALGHLWYSWRDKDRPEDGLKWWGVAAIAVFREDMGPGAGVALEFGRTMTLGIAWHDDNDNEDWFDSDPYVVMSVDLLSFLRENAPHYREIQSRAEKRFSDAFGR